MDGVPSRRVSGRLAAVVVAIAGAALLLTAGSAVAGVKPRAQGTLDCNGYSPIQRTVHPGFACTDPRAINANKGGRFEDNEHYIGHDEPIVRFLSHRAGSGNDTTWTETLPRDPSALPTVANPGSDITHQFELTIAPWFSMALCNSRSFPLRRCIPNSDSNAPNPADGTSGGGSSFLEAQFYPPGFAPFADNISLRQHPLVRVAAHQRPGVHAPAAAATPTAPSRPTSRSSRPTASPPGLPARSCPTWQRRRRTATRC